MFERIKKRLDTHEELQQLRREIRVMRNENAIKTSQVNGLMDKLKAAKARDEMHEKERKDLHAQIEQINQQVIQREKDALEATENLKRQEHENGQLREQLERQSCPADCKHKTNPNACRPCSRYPFARDKYEKGE